MQIHTLDVNLSFLFDFVDQYDLLTFTNRTDFRLMLVHVEMYCYLIGCHVYLQNTSAMIPFRRFWSLIYMRNFKRLSGHVDCVISMSI